MSTKRGMLAAIGEKAVQRQGVIEKPADRINPVTHRDSALEALSGSVVYSQDKWVDPALCRPSRENARDYDALTYEDCEDLIGSIKAEGQQRFPAIVRPTEDDAQPYEIIAGLRRHWAISWLRANSYPDFRYLITVQKMDDETAFRLSDLENRARADITDLERGMSYRDALSRHYHGDTERMAERLSLSARNLRRYIQLAELEEVIVEALGGKSVAKVVHATTLKTEMAKSAAHSSAVLNEASVIASEQTHRRKEGAALMPAPEVVKRLIQSTSRKPTGAAAAAKATVSIRANSGKPMIEYVAGTTRTASVLRILPKSDATLEEVTAAVIKVVEDLYASQR